MNFLTRKNIQSEIEEKSEDLRVFSHARDLIRARVLEVSDSSSQLTPLPQWSGTDAVLGSLDLAINAMSHTVDELKDLLETLPEDQPALRLVKDGDE